MHLCNIESIEYVDDKPGSCYSFVMTGTEYFVPFTANVDVEAERAKIQQELTYLQGFLKSVESKLNNERFVSKAPADVLEVERKKQSDTLAKIHMLEEQLSSL
jgi:valyl-tRNA synthetase